MVDDELRRNIQGVKSQRNVNITIRHLATQTRGLSNPNFKKKRNRHVFNELHNYSRDDFQLLSLTNIINILRTLWRPRAEVFKLSCLNKCCCFDI